MQKAEKDSGDLKFDSAKKQIDILSGALKESEARSTRELWEHPGWWVAGGFIVGAAVATLATYASIWSVGQLRPALPPAASTE